MKAGGEAGHGEEGHRPWAVDPPPRRDLSRRAGDLLRVAYPSCPVWADDSSVACHFTTQMITSVSCLLSPAISLPRAAVH